MSVYQDQRGITYTVASQDAVDHFDATITEYLHMGTEAGARLKETLAADLEFPMPSGSSRARGCPPLRSRPQRSTMRRNRRERGC